MTSKRNIEFCIDDILNASKKLENFTKDIDKNEFLNNELINLACIKLLEIIGEATKNFPDEIKSKYTNVEWENIKGMRNKLIHYYFGTNLNIV